MGITTPFPEPDSPELQRFIVHSAEEVAELLRALSRRAVPLNVFLEPGSAFGVAALLEVNEDRGEVVFESLGEPLMHERLLGAPCVTFVGFVDAVKLQFKASCRRPSVGGGRYAFAVSTPTQLLRLQRRSTIRLRPGLAGAVLCYVGPADDYVALKPLRVLDISAGGLALLGDPRHFLPTIGSRMENCRIELPRVGSVEVDLRVRHVVPFLGADILSVGCEFDALAPSAQALLDAYLLQLGTGKESPSKSVPPRPTFGAVPRRWAGTADGMRAGD